MPVFLDYLVAVTPATALVALAVALIPTRLVGARTVTLILGFLFVRDMMTPAGLWSFATSPRGVPWMRFGADPIAYWLLAGTSLALMAGVVLGLGRKARSLLVLTQGRPWSAAAWGVGGAVLIVASIAALNAGTPLSDRGGPVPIAALPAILAMAVVGNALEELLFRGYLQGLLVASRSDLSGTATPESRGPWQKELRAAVATGVLFGTGHLHLAFLVTDVGVPLILFTLFEGIVCGIVRWRSGLVAATLTHGLAIVALASGLV